MIRRKGAKKIKAHTHPEQWFVEQLRAYTSRLSRSTMTPACREDSFLRSYAAKPESFSLSDPRVEHVTSCSHCLQALLELQSEIRDRRAAPAGQAARALLGTVYSSARFVVARLWKRLPSRISQSPAAQQATVAVDRTLDLANYGPDSGTEKWPPRPPLHLPAALLRVTLVLPRFSGTGAYTITVAASGTESACVARATGIAVTGEGQTELTVTLDLTRARPGRFVLLIEASEQIDSYSYPLNVE